MEAAVIVVMNETADEATLAFYRREAKRYCELAGAAPTAALEKFLSYLLPGATVLELGCGCGRDSAEMLRQGYAVVPTDGVPEMARQAELRVGRPVQVLEFGNIEGESKFDGIWANACLLHVPKAQLINVIERLHRVLSPNGILFASFKAGSGEGRDRFGRYYNYLSLSRLKHVFEQSVAWRLLEIEEVPGVGYDGIPVAWLNCTAMK